jgi:hypothetical protein
VGFRVWTLRSMVKGLGFTIFLLEILGLGCRLDDFGLKA